MSLSDLEVFLAEIAEALSLVYVFVTFAQNGIVGVILYIIGWSFISMVFETVGKEIPSPLKIIWRIFQDLVEIFV
jgi:hypothetical protein